MKDTIFPKYQLSGKFTPSGLIPALGLGLLGVVLFSPAYALATFYIPFIYVLFLFTILCGAGVGWLTAQGLIKGHVRSRKMAIVFGLLMGLCATYVQWVVWLYIGERSLFLNPVELFSELKALGRHGVWSLESWTPKGAILYGIWFVEAAIITGLSTWLAAGTLEDSIYCEHCKTWLKDSEHSHILFDLPDAELLEALERGEFASIKKLKKYKNTAQEGLPPDPALGLRLSKCSTCENLYLISLIKYTYSFDSDGDTKTSEDALVDKLMINKALYKDLSE